MLAGVEDGRSYKESGGGEVPVVAYKSREANRNMIEIRRRRDWVRICKLEWKRGDMTGRVEGGGRGGGNMHMVTYR